MLEVLSLEPLTARQAEFVAVTHRSGQLLRQLLNDVLDLSKAETTSVQLTHRPFSPAEVAGKVVAALQPVSARRRLGLDLVVRGNDLLGGGPSRRRPPPPRPGRLRVTGPRWRSRPGRPGPRVPACSWPETTRSTSWSPGRC